MLYDCIYFFLQNSRFEEITVVRNGGTHGNISVNWILTRNSSDPSPVTADIRPSSGVLHFAQGQMLASVPLTVVNDDLPEEAEAYLLQILPRTVQGGAEVSEPAEVDLLLCFTHVNVSVIEEPENDYTDHTNA